jgi:CheY-like chemotaxis protein
VKPQATQAHAAEVPLVVVAHDSEAIREAVSRLLNDSGYRVTSVGDGEAAMGALDSPDHPAALVLDVAIPGVLSYQIIERVKEKRLPTKTVLVASVYNRAGYKRRPVSLYGADDYVEQHHIPDLLLLKLAKLLGRPAPDGELVSRAVERDEEPIRVAGEARLGLRYRTPEEGLQRARRLARLIATDIALYNRELFAHRDPDEREALLREDLEEGRLLFELRVPRSIRGDADFVGEALAEMAATMTPAGDGEEER